MLFSKLSALSLVASGAFAMKKQHQDSFGAACTSNGAYSCEASGVSATYFICTYAASGKLELLPQQCGANQVCKSTGSSIYCDAGVPQSTSSATSKTGTKTTTTKTRTGTMSTTTNTPTETTPSGSTTTTTKTTKMTTSTKTGSPTPGTFAYRPAPNPVGIIGYWPNWAIYSRAENSPQSVDLTGINILNYAFMDALADGTLRSFDGWADFGGTAHPTFPFVIDEYSGKSKAVYQMNFVAREKYPNLRTVISVGGWSGSGTFSKIAASDAATKKFVTQIHSFLDTMHFDGVDIDWEYPGGGGLPCNAVNNADAANFVKFAAALRAELGPDRIVSIASSGEVSRYADPATKVSYLKALVDQLSYVQVMTYDFYGSWVPYSDFNSPLRSPSGSDPQQPAGNGQFGHQFSIENSMQQYVDAGIPKSKLVSGVAYYGRSWGVQKSTTQTAINGLYSACQLPEGKSQNVTNAKSCPPIPGDQLDADWTDPCGQTYKSGVWMYRNLRQQGVLSSPTTAGNGWTRKYFDFAQSPTLFDGSRFISYDDPQSIAAKAAWTKQNGYGGVMFWELSEDYRGEMTSALRNSFNSFQVDAEEIYDNTK